MLNGIEKEIRKANRGEVDRNIEFLKEVRDQIEENPRKRWICSEMNAAEQYAPELEWLGDEPCIDD